MPTFSTSTYHLALRAPLHVGERGVGLEATRTYVPADTLFSALCSMWRELYGVDALRGDVLDWFTEDEGGNEPFFLSSAFPFAGSVRLFPKPLARVTNITVTDNHDKAFKRVRFVSERIFTAMVSGEKLDFSKEDCVNGKTVWVTPEEKAQLADWQNNIVDDIMLWQVAIVPRVTLDRITSASEIWHFGEVRFCEGIGLWFTVEFNDEHGDVLRHKFEACLRVLGDTGLGGERGAGRGLFTWVQVTEEPLPRIDDAGRFITLAPLCPKDAAQLAALTATGAAYDLMPRRGWVTSPEASNLRRKMLWMFAEGSVLTGDPTLRTGGLVNVKPDACPHDVWRYGCAFPVGMKA